MKKLVTAEMMRKLEEFAIKEYKIDVMDLMNNAGAKVAEKILLEEKNIEKKKIVVFCGKGNNGGDGLVAAENLLKKKLNVEIYFLCLRTQLSDITKQVFSRMEKFHKKIHFIKAYHEKYLKNCDIIVDAIFGTGFNANPEGLFFETMEGINNSSATVYAVDIPSGLHGTTGSKEDIAVYADYTITFAYAKIGLFIRDGYSHSGEVEITSIGFPKELDEEVPDSTSLIEDDDCSDLLTKRPLVCDKKDFGKVFNFAGSLAMPGAAVLSSLAALRTGCGLLRLGVPMNISAAISVTYPEIMNIPLSYTQPGFTSVGAEKEILKGYKWGDAILVGPGLHVYSETKKIVKKLFVKLFGKPLVLDADALNILSENVDFFEKMGEECVITPHNSEMSRLANMEKEFLMLDRLDIASAKAKEWGCFVVLKGTPTIVATPRGEVKIYVHKMPAMATGGMGDVLSGIIVSLMAQGYKVIDAIVLGLNIHKCASKLALAKKNERSLLASDLVSEISNALDYLEKNRKETVRNEK